MVVAVRRSMVKVVMLPLEHSLETDSRSVVSKIVHHFQQIELDTRVVEEVEECDLVNIISFFVSYDFCIKIID